MSDSRMKPTREKPLGDVTGELRGTLASALKSPALDFYAIAVIGALLIGLGLVMVLSSSSVTNIAEGRSPYAGFASQGLYAVIGLVFLVVAALLPPSFYKRREVAMALLVIGIGLQLLVFIPGIGLDTKGNRNWIKLGPIRGQPSELLKLALAVWLGSFLASNRARLREWKVLGFALCVVGLVVLLVMLGKDLGTVLIMGMLVAGAFWTAGVPRRFFGGVAILGVLGAIGAVVVSPNRITRISNWFHGVCEGTSCFQANNGLMALAGGGWWGVGLGKSRQKWGRVPEADNDFIFAIIGEELGLMGTLLIVGLFTLLAVVLYRMVMRVRDPFVQITAAAITAWILGQAFVNMGVVTGMLPVLGVPLPFVSSGGSALLASMMALGVLFSFARSEPGAKEAIAARGWWTKRTAAVVAPGPGEAHDSVASSAPRASTRVRRQRKSRT